MPDYRISLINVGAGSKKVNTTIVASLKDIREAETRAKEEILRKSVIGYMPEFANFVNLVKCPDGVFERHEGRAISNYKVLEAWFDAGFVRIEEA